MKTRRLAVAAATTLIVLFSQLPENCRAGGYRSSGTPYRAPGSGTVYGFGSNGQSFVYRPPSGSGMYGQNARGTASYGPQYRLDGFTAPRTARNSRPVPSSQPAFFSGRVWYPRGY